MTLRSCNLFCAQQLDIMEPKVPDDIYKTHLENNSKSISEDVFNIAGLLTVIELLCGTTSYLDSVCDRVWRQRLPGGLCSYELGLFLRERLR